jgi:maleate isomerase
MIGEGPVNPSRFISMHHFGVLIPPTNTTAEIDYNRLLPSTLRAHVVHIPLFGTGSAVHPGHSYDALETQARVLGHAGVEVISLMQTTASLDSDDFDEIVVKRMRDAAGVPAVTASQAIGHAVRALGARRIALVAPAAMSILEREKHHYEHKYGLEIVALKSCSVAGGPEALRDAMARINRPEIEVMIVRGGGTLPTMAFISEWERAFCKPVINPSQALLWAMLDIMKVEESLPGPGRLLIERPQQV